MCVHAPTRIQLNGMTRDKAMQLTAPERTAYCVSMKDMTEGQMATVKKCFPQFAPLLMGLCPSDSGTAILYAQIITHMGR